MGITASSETPTLTKEQQDIQYLGERFPFGNEELLRFYRSHYFLQYEKSAIRVSFLTDWAIYCAFLDKQEGVDDISQMQKKRIQTLQIIESFILPKSFGEALQQTVFSRSQDVNSSLLEASPACSYVSSNDIEAHCTDRLEQFLEGAATSCGRRGGRAALVDIFQCCASIEKRTTETPAEKEAIPYSSNDGILAARASGLVDIGYRLTLAALALSDSGDDVEEDVDLMSFVPSDSIGSHPAMVSLANSLVQFAKRKRERSFSDENAIESTSELLEGLVTKEEFLEWAETTAPLLSSSLPTLMQAIFFPDRPYPPSRTPLAFPRLNNESAFFESPTSPLLFSFACMSSAIGGNWHRIYTSENDGLSFNRLQVSLLGYGGPTLLIISNPAPDQGIFGAFTASPWKETKAFYGNSDCFLYQMLPATTVFRPTGNSTNYMYCNSEARSKGYDGLAHGIGFGGDSEEPRLFISESFDGCVASSQDLTFERGALLPRCKNGGLPGKSFDIETFEVWGVGGDEVVADALGARHRQREITAANIQKARKVDKAQFLEDFQSGLIESKAFKHRGEIRGREDSCIDNDHKKAYVYEK